MDAEDLLLPLGKLVGRKEESKRSVFYVLFEFELLTMKSFPFDSLVRELLFFNLCDVMI